MQRDVHFYLTLAMAKRAKLLDHEAKMIAWANFMTDCHRATQLKWNSFSNPGPWFHFVEQDGKVVYHPKGLRDLLDDITSEPVYMTLDYMRLGIALHSLQDSWSHNGWYGRFSKDNVARLGRGYWFIPPYGHAQLLKAPDRVEMVYTHPRTLATYDNRFWFREALRWTFMYLARLTGVKPETEISDIEDVTTTTSYAMRKAEWAKLAGMPTIRFSDITSDYYKVYKREFLEAARLQKIFLTQRANVV